MTWGELYQQGRDVAGHNHCYVAYLSDTEMRLVFPGFESDRNMDKFITCYLSGFAHTFDIREQQITIKRG